MIAGPGPKAGLQVVPGNVAAGAGTRFKLESSCQYPVASVGFRRSLKNCDCSGTASQATPGHRDRGNLARAPPSMQTHPGPVARLSWGRKIHIRLGSPGNGLPA